MQIRYLWKFENPWNVLIWLDLSLCFLIKSAHLTNNCYLLFVSMITIRFILWKWSALSLFCWIYINRFLCRLWNFILKLLFIVLNEIDICIIYEYVSENRRRLSNLPQFHLKQKMINIPIGNNFPRLTFPRKESELITSDYASGIAKEKVPNAPPTAKPKKCCRKIVLFSMAV